MTWKFTLIHDVLGSQEITEPGGWKTHKKKWVRHPKYFSLVESLEAELVFYGRNDTEELNGGIEFINQVEAAYGFDANIRLVVEVAEDDVVYVNYFDGLLNISALQRSPDNTATIPVLQSTILQTLLNRWDSPVDLSSTTDLDGSAVNPVESITVNMTPQLIRQNYHAYIDDGGESYAAFTNGSYYWIDFNDVVILDEIKERRFIPRVDDIELPLPLFTIEYGGLYTFDIRIIASTFTVFNAESVKNPTDFIDYYIQFGNDSPIAFSFADESVGAGTHTLFTYSATHELTPNTSIRIYGQANTTSAKDLIILGGASTGFSGSSEFASYLEINADTTYPATESEGYLIHDLIYGVLDRILGADKFYSEFLGGLNTNARQYDANGCGWMYFIVKGLQIRQYTLNEKPFFISMNQIWDGINPILNLGLGYEEIEGSQVIRIEQKSHFIGDASPVNFDNVREISSSYDQDFIFKAVKTGYRKWQSEQASGIDDPQTKHTYALPPKVSGIELNLESDFIAASYAIETIRRTKRQKSTDHKYDNDNFIISLNTDDVSPDVYIPEQDENFQAITGLLNSSTRYNLILTPLRNLLRWANYIGGCLQNYVTADPVYNFVSGEGNYDMASDAILGSCSRAIIGDNLSESGSIALGGGGGAYNIPIGYFFLPILYQINIPMEKEDFDLIDRKEPIGISQTTSGHATFHIKELEYEIVKGEAVIKAWPEEFFNITIPDQEITTPSCL